MSVQCNVLLDDGGGWLVHNKENIRYALLSRAAIIAAGLHLKGENTRPLTLTRCLSEANFFFFRKFHSFQRGEPV